MRSQLRGDADDLQTLVMFLALVLVVFAFGFYALERSDPGQVAGLRTRIDAFYFTLATMATVGYGDVHAAGQVARALTAAQMIFNIIFVGALAAVLTGRVRIRAQERERARLGSPTAGEVPAPSLVPPSASSPSRTTAGVTTGTVDALPVDEMTAHLLAGLARADPTALGLSTVQEDPRQMGGLDPRTRAPSGSRAWSRSTPQGRRTPIPWRRLSTTASRQWTSSTSSEPSLPRSVCRGWRPALPMS